MLNFLVDTRNGSIKDDVLSGVTVALALVPEAVAFAFVAGVSPIVGLYGAFMMGLVTSLFGGRPGMISGATGAMAVVMVALVRDGSAMHPEGDMMGLQYLFVTLILCGMLQVGAGVARLGTFVRMIPNSVMMGFVNGLAIVIFLSQLEMFQVHGHGWMTGPPLYTMLGLTALTMAIMAFLPRLTSAVPAALTAILVVTGLVLYTGIPTATVGSFIAERGGDGLAAGLPSFAIPVIPLSLATLTFVFPYAVILAAVGLIESLMTLTLVDELTETRGSANQECIAQGAGNLLNGFFGGMGGCAMIGQSIINVKSGGRGRLSGLVASVTLLGFILFASSAIEQVPIAALVGVMFMVVIGTFAWNTFKILNKVPASDVVVMISVTLITVRFDLATAVLSGVVLAALVFAWENALRIRARKHVDEHGIKHYEIRGPLFFGSTTLFLTKFDVAGDPDEVIIDFAESRIMDQSALETIDKLADRYLRAGKHLHLRHVSPDCARLLERAGDLCEINVLEDPDYLVAVDTYRNSPLAAARRDAAKGDLAFGH